MARAAAGLGAISATTLDHLVDEFATDFSAGADLFGDAGQVKNLLADSLPPEQIADILGVESSETNAVDVWQDSGASAGKRDHRAFDGGTLDDSDLYPLQAQPGCRDQDYQWAPARSAQRSALRTRRAARRHAARRAAHRGVGRERIETDAQVSRRRPMGARVSPASSTASIRRKRRTPCERSNKPGRRTRPP